MQAGNYLALAATGIPFPIVLLGKAPIIIEVQELGRRCMWDTDT